MLEGGSLLLSAKDTCEYSLCEASLQKIKSINSASELLSKALSLTRRVLGRYQLLFLQPLASRSSLSPMVKLRLVTPSLYVRETVCMSFTTATSLLVREGSVSKHESFFLRFCMYGCCRRVFGLWII